MCKFNMKFKRWLNFPTLLHSVALTLTFCSLSTRESQYSETWRHKVILQGKGCSGLSYLGNYEILASHLPGIEKCWKVSLIRQSHLIIFKPLKLVLCSSCDGVPLKFKKKNRRASIIPAQIK
jgi:hypothetical protein